MNYWNSYVFFRDTHIDEIFDPITSKIEYFLNDKNYGSEVERLDTVINCSYGLENMPQRNRFSRKEKYLYFDIILDCKTYMNLTNAARKNYIAESFLRDMEILRKYKPKGFLLDELRNDFKRFFESIGWLLPNE